MKNITTYSDVKEYIYENFGFHVSDHKDKWGYRTMIPLGNNNNFTLDQVKELVEKFGGKWDYFYSGQNIVYTYLVYLELYEVSKNRWDM